MRTVDATHTTMKQAFWFVVFVSLQIADKVTGGRVRRAIRRDFEKGQ